MLELPSDAARGPGDDGPPIGSGGGGGRDYYPDYMERKTWVPAGRFAPRWYLLAALVLVILVVSLVAVPVSR